MSIKTKPISRNSSKESSTSNSPPRIKNKIMDILMEKSFLNFIYWILLKSAESYYGESMKTEIPYTPYF